MKRLRSCDDGLDSYDDKASTKDSSQSRFSSRSFYLKSDNIRKGLMSMSSSSSSRYDRDRLADDDGRESSRMIWKRSDHDFNSFERRKGLGLGFDRYSNREGYNGNSGGERSVHRSESFSGSRRDFPKGVRSDRDRSRREGSVSSWRRFGGGSKEFEESRGNALRSSPKGLRDVRSPSWSRDSGSDQNRLSRESKRDEGRVKSSTSKSRSSPSWSKESGSEQSKSVEVAKKNVMEVKEPEKEAESVQSKSSSEMEEGELEPEPESVPPVKKDNQNGSETEAQEDVKMNDVAEGLQKERQGVERVSEAEKDSNKLSDSDMHNVLKKTVETQNGEKNFGGNGNVSEDEVGNVGDDEGDREGKNLNECREEGSEDTVSEKLVSFGKETRKESGINLEDKVEGDEMEDTNKEVTAESGGAEVYTVAAKENLNSNAKDKGKSVIVSSAEAADTVEDGACVERKSRFIQTFGDGDDDVEGPSTRGFELFTRSPVRRTEKPEQSIDDKNTDGKLVLEPLDLSLSLPNVLLPIGATRDTTQAPGSPSHGRSVQSFSTLRTTSDGFTGSMSFSGSQSFFHNPSCSLTQNSFDVDNNEQSVHSRPIFQGIWQGQAINDSTLKDTPLYQKFLMNGNGSLQQGISNSQAKHGNSKMPNGLERQLSFHKQLSSGQTRNQDDTKSPSQSVGSHDMGSNYSFERKQSMRDKHGSTLYSSNSLTEQQLLIGGADFVDAIISRIVSDPIHVMARKFHEMTGQSAACLKESIREIMLNPNKKVQLCAVQSALQNRSDLNLDVLLKSHRVQLEILVSLKTGLHEYLQMDSSISSSDLAEVFLNLRCRNLACRNPLLVDECDCKICVKKNGFCSACMCLVCSKFDMESNTCSWLGCDVCLHWCHTDCALQESYIRNGRSTNGAPGTTEVQFYCGACDHPSEMFGFVKEVFKNFAKDWSAETFCNELKYVKRLFSVSKDIRGRQLHEIADQMLLLMDNKSNLPNVYNHVMNVLNASDSSKLSNASASTFGPKDQGNSSNGGISGPSQDMAWLRPAYAEKPSQLERSSSLLPTFHNDLTSKQPMKLELQGAQVEPLFDELESIVRIKQAEAEMFQSRSDDARREAEALKRIALAKNEKIEEEYTSRISKLRLVEAEEMRKKKLEELQALERAHREYFSMKMRMESDIKDLLLRMEATKQNLAI